MEIRTCITIAHFSCQKSLDVVIRLVQIRRNMQFLRLFLKFWARNDSFWTLGEFWSSCSDILAFG